MRESARDKNVQEQLDSKEAELTSAQQEIKTLTDEMLALRPPEYGLNLIRFVVGLPADEVEARLKELSASNLLLEDGESLSAKEPNRYQPELNLYLGNAQVIQSDVEAWGWDYDADEQPVRNWQTEEQQPVAQWGRELNIRIWYSNGENEACQKIGVQTWSRRAGETPRIYRDITAPAYAETGYEGHNQSGRNATDEEVVELVALARILFESRLQ